MVVIKLKVFNFSSALMNSKRASVWFKVVKLHNFVHFLLQPTAVLLLCCRAASYTFWEKTSPSEYCHKNDTTMNGSDPATDNNDRL